MADQPNDPFATNPNPASSSDPVATLLSQIKNEKGEQKYDSLPKALEGLLHAQQYIPTIKGELQKKEEELAKLRAELDQRTSVEDVVSRLVGKKDPEDDKAGKQPGVANLDPNAIEGMLDQLLQKRQVAESAKTNRSKVVAELQKAYGDKTSEVIAEKAKELGITPDDIGKLASQNPSVALALFTQKGPVGPKTTTNSVNIPPYATKPAELEKPAKSLLSGVSSRDQAAYMRDVIKPYIFKKHGITQN